MIADESSQTTQLLSAAPTWLADSSAASYVSAIAHHTYERLGFHDHCSFIEGVFHSRIGRR